MRVTYDPEADAINIRLSDKEWGRTEAYTDQLIVDFDQAGNVKSIELLDVSKFVTHPNHIDFRIFDYAQE